MLVKDQREKCPVRPGDIWRSGRHWFGCGDLTEGSTLARLLTLAPSPTLLYSDPPWHESDTKRYWTMARRDGVSGAPPGWERTLRAVLTLAADRHLLAYIEMSHLSADDAVRVAQAMGARTEHSWAVEWLNAGKPVMQRIFSADWRPTDEPVSPIPDGVRFDVAPQAALSGHERGVVIDPCCGNGWTVRAAERLGWTALAHELTPRRLWTAMLRTGTDHDLVHRA